MGTRMKYALVLAGVSYRQAAAMVRFADHRDVYWAAKRLGIVDLHRDRLEERRLERLHEDLVEGPDRTAGSASAA